VLYALWCRYCVVGFLLDVFVCCECVVLGSVVYVSCCTFVVYVFLCMFCVVDFVVQILCCRSSVAGIALDIVFYATVTLYQSDDLTVELVECML
jgi:hypothetical protein